MAYAMQINHRFHASGPCGNPGTPQNGLKIGSDFRHGRKVRFVCQLGFKLTGISSITCQDGRWSDQVPVCKGNGRVSRYLDKHERFE